MPKTKVVNMTGSSIVLKESIENAHRVLCPDLKPGNAYIIKTDQHAADREYLCTEQEDRRLVLSSDDCMDYEEVHIRFREDTATIVWEGVTPRKTKCGWW